jgi:sec-independent protein translocase protein TatA
MFDPSAPHIIILMVVVLLLFGARRLPGAAKSLGESMHIFKRSVQGLNPEDQHDNAATPPSSVIVPPAVLPPAVLPTAHDAANQQQLADLQRQVEDLQRQAAGGGARSEDQTAQPR